MGVFMDWKLQAVPVYITSASSECYSEWKDVIIKTKLTIDRSSYSEVLYKKDVLKNLPKLTEKNLRQSFFLIKSQTSSLQIC